MSTDILSRTYAGLTVEIHYGHGNLALSVREGDEGIPQTVAIDPQNVIDAFKHPYCYLPRQTSSVGREDVSELSELEVLEYWRELRATSADRG